MKRLIYAALIAGIPLAGYAQDQTDALRYSQLTFGGTARFMAMGGAFCAIGGDMSTLTFNPAGIAVFNKSQLAFTPGFAFQNVSSNYNGVQMTANQGSVNMQNAGWVASWKNTRGDAMWKGLSFGLVYNRTNDFNSQLNIQGNNYNSTLLDEYTAQANGTPYANLDQFYAGPAFKTYLLDTIHGNSYFNLIHPYLGNGTNYVLQQLNKQTSGSMGETDISFGANYKSKLYLGASIGIADIYYNENSTYSETPSYRDTAFGLLGYTLGSTINTSGAGLNFKIGAIYRINEWARIGAAVHTPTVFSLTDNYSTEWNASYDASPYSASGGVADNTANGNYNYTLITPMRAMAGVAFIIHHQGILSAEYEYVDYATASFNSPGYSYSTVNSAIAQQYMAANNFRVGAEWVLYPFSIRAGYAMYGNPYTSMAGNSTVKDSYSVGAGVRIRRCFIDAAYVLTTYTGNYYLYGAAYGGTPSLNTVNVSSVALTFGVNF